MDQAHELTLGDLLDGEFGLKLVTSDPRAREKPVAGAHSIEVGRPGTWLERDWIMLTNGLRLRRSAQAQRELVADLDGIGACALGFALDVGLQEDPSGSPR